MLLTWTASSASLEFSVDIDDHRNRRGPPARSSVSGRARYPEKAGQPRCRPRGPSAGLCRLKTLLLVCGLRHSQPTKPASASVSRRGQGRVRAFGWRRCARRALGCERCVAGETGTCSRSSAPRSAPALETARRRWALAAIPSTTVCCGGGTASVTVSQVVIFATDYSDRLAVR